MEMSVDNAVLSVVLKGIGDIKSLLEDTEEIEKNFAQVNLDSRDASSWEEPKKLVDNLFKQVSKLKKDFYEKYELLPGHSTIVEEVPKNLDPVEDEVVANNSKQTEDINVSSTPSENATGNEESLATEITENVQQTVDKTIGEPTTNDETNKEISDKDNTENEKTTDDSNGNEVEAPLIESDNPDVIDTSIQNGEPLLETNKTIVKKEEEGQKPFLRLVSLSKLIDPDVKKRSEFSQSILIISSDEETPLANGSLKSTDVPLPKEKTKKAEKSPSKDKKTRNSKEKEYLEISDSDDDSQLQHKKKGNSDSSGRRRETNVSKKDSECKENEKHDNSSDESSNMDDDHKSRKSSRLKRTQNSREESMEKLNVSEKDPECKKNEKLDNISDESSDMEDDHKSRKSWRLKKTQNSKKERMEKLKKIFKRKTSKKDTDSDDESDSKGRKYSKRNKSSRSESHQPISLSESDEEDLVHKKEKESQRKSIDKKFTYDVYIPLPFIKCDDLKTIYEKRKELLEIEKLTNLQTLKKRTKKCDSESTSSMDESTKQVRKRARKNKKSEDMSVSNSENSEGDEMNNSDPLALTPRAECLPADTETVLANIALENLGSSDCDNTEGKDREVQKSKKCGSSAKDVVDKDTASDEQIEDSSTNGDKTCVDNNSNSLDSKKKDEEKENISDGSLSETEKSKKKWKKDKLLTEKLDNTDSEDKEKSKDTTRKTKKKIKNKNLSSDSDRDSKKSNSDSDKSDSDSEAVKKSQEERKKKSKKISLTSDSDNSQKSKENQSESDKSSSDSDRKNRKDKRKANKINKKKKVLSDSDDNSFKSKDASDKSSGSEKSSCSNKSDEEAEENKKKTRRRIKKTHNSSSDEGEDKSTRKKIRTLIDRDSLSATTKEAEAAEKERKARIAEKQKKYNQILEEMKESKVEKVILEYDEEKKQDLVPVHKHFVEKLKPHQASGVRFMWDACFESLEMIEKGKGGGCILAHCMGLGKTLQVITLAHTLISSSETTKVERILVVCPVSTVLNWKAEFKLWMPKRCDIEVFELVSCKNYQRQYRVKEWVESGGVMIIGYTMFTLLTNPNNKKMNKKTRATFYEGLVDPGPDLVVCDEGHLLKNEKTNLSIAMNRIKTNRRIVLTGTPLQNNMKEYWCMVQFIKPNLLGTYKEYLNRFVNPITNGQYTDSTKHDIDLMRKRSHVLHKLLDGIVQRKDYSVLAPYLPPKHEYVLFIKLTEMQVKIYLEYLEKYARKMGSSNRASFLFKDFQVFQRIAIHPRALLYKSKEKEEDDEEESEGSLKDFIDDGEASSSNKSNNSSSNSSDSESGSNTSVSGKKKYQQRKRVTRAQAALKKDNGEDSDSDIEILSKKEWWQEYCNDEELDNLNNSAKLFLLFEILKSCEEIGDKILVFSQSLFTLDCIEYFLEKIDEATQNGTTEKVGGHSGSWSLGLDYFRLDGSSSCDNRANWCNMFNNPSNTRARLFLISTRAGGLGINLVAANRVIIFDVSWNPSHDIQSVYRVFRFGQTKPCYIYRFVTYGAMEMKVYERQVTKQAISKRVIDEQQIDRHYNQNDLQELYQCDLHPQERPIPLVPKDVLLGEMLQKYDKTIYKYHEHQSLLENKESEELNEEERKAAWEEFENEKVIRKSYTTNLPTLGTNAQTIAEALASIVRRDNPTWSEVQIRGIVPALVRQLQMQLAEGDTSMFTRVQREIMMMQRAYQQQMTSGIYSMYQMNQQIQHQQQNNNRLDNFQLNPAALMAGNWPPQQRAYVVNPVPGPSNRQQLPTNPTDVIDLND